MVRTPALFCVLLSVAAAAASPSVVGPGRVLVGAGSAAKADTFTVYGGPGVLEGKFQDAAGAPDEQGWYGVDLTAQSTVLWQVTGFLAGDMKPAEPTNQAWWCGEFFADDCGTGDTSGYGNNLRQKLDRNFTAPDPALDTTVRVTALRKQDTEPGYDYLVLQRRTPSGWVQEREWTGTTAGTELTDLTFVVPVADCTGPGGDAIVLRWLAASDGAWSDADCLWPTQGHTRLDDIEVFLDGVSQGVETCESGDPLDWTPTTSPGVGDFAQVWPLLADLDDCVDNPTPQWAFIDDGVVEPCSGGTAGSLWTYGPGGFVTNNDGGCSEDYAVYLHNEIRSPPIALTPGLAATRLSFDLYSHLPVFGSPVMTTFWTWHVRSSLDGGVTWSGWESDQFLSDGPAEYARIEKDVSGNLEPGATHLQVALGVIQYTFGMSPPFDSTPAPYFDNVRVQQWSHDGPYLAAAAGQLAHDAFPAHGQIDLANPGTNSVRFDMAMDLLGTTSPNSVHGDSIVVVARPLRADADLTEVSLHYALRRNPLFDPWRTAGLPDDGVVAGVQCLDSGGVPVPDRYAFDLPDSGFLFPGDQLHYYFSATDRVDGDPGTAMTTTLPADFTTFHDFPDPDGSGAEKLRYGPDHWPNHFTVNALPTIERFETYRQREFLVWIDCESTDILQLLTALDMDAYVDVAPFDVFATHAPESGLGNGLGACATPLQIQGYETILYLSGKQRFRTLTGPLSGVPNSGGKSDDLALVTAWLDETKGFLASGDHLATDLLSEPTGAGQSFLHGVFGVTLSNSDLAYQVGGPVNPPCLATDWPFLGQYAFHADGDCPESRTFDALTAFSPNTYRVAEVTDSSGLQGTTPYGAVFRVGAPYAGGLRLFSPLAVSAWGHDDDPEIDGGPVRLRLLLDVLEALGLIDHIMPGAETPSAPSPFYARTHPNPFNPQVTIEFGMPRAGAARIVMHDARGRAVRTLLDAELSSGAQTTVWDGRADDGRALPSGVYFAIVEAAGERAVRKLALVR